MHMPPDVIAASQETAKQSRILEKRLDLEPSDSLFEQVAWLYAFCRERIFRDDTERIVAALWPNRRPVPGTTLIELGCGPGFYSRKLARRFPEISTTGVDRSESQLRWARQRAGNEGLSNCLFQQVNALMIPYDSSSFDVLIASRLFTVIADTERAITEMHRVLRPGGRCFVAEPRYRFWASLPLFGMWLLASTTHSHNGYREPRKATVYSGNEFANLFASQPWNQVKIWRDGRYQYALCQKA
jgi:arsenite methyltransferase